MDEALAAVVRRLAAMLASARGDDSEKGKVMVMAD